MRVSVPLAQDRDRGKRSHSLNTLFGSDSLTPQATDNSPAVEY